MGIDFATDNRKLLESHKNSGLYTVRFNHWKHQLKLNTSHRKPKVTDNTAPTDSVLPLRDPAAWKIIEEFAAGEGDITLPQTIDKLQAHLGNAYRYEDWKPAYEAVFNAEEDTIAALNAVQALAEQAQHQQAEGRGSTESASEMDPQPSIAELTKLETDLMDAVEDLYQRKRIRGGRPTLEELINPSEENEVGDSPYRFPGGDDEIIDTVLKGSGTKAQQDELDEEEEDIDDKEPDIPSAREGVRLCEQLEQLCLAYSDANGVATLELQTQLRRLRRHLHQVDLSSHKQSTLDSFLVVRRS